MGRKIWKAGTFEYPLPAVMVSCGTMEKSNIITIAWTGILNTNPAMVYISVRPTRYSYNLIKESKEFVINLTNKRLAYATDWCGVRSGRDYKKFKETGLTPMKGNMVSAPCVVESPLSIECRVKEIVKLGSHDMFIADVLCTDADDAFMNKETGAFDLESARLVAYSHGHYYKMGEEIGKFGWSVQKKQK